MTLLKKYPPEGFIKQKHQYMLVIIVIYATFSCARNLREGFGTKLTESLISLRSPGKMAAYLLLAKQFIVNYNFNTDMNEGAL